MSALGFLSNVPLPENWADHTFSDFVWANRYSDKLRRAVRAWGLAYAYELAPLMGDRAERLTEELDTCGKTGPDSGWAEAATRGKHLKSHFVEDGALLPGYWACHIAMQFDRGTVNAALDIAWAMKRARSYSSALLLTDLKAHMEGGHA